MRKIFFLALALLFAASIGFAQDEAADTTASWNKGGIGTVNLNQTGLWNWAQGGVNNITVNAYLNLFANYKSPKSTWDNSLDLAYGLVRQMPEDEPAFFTKGDDKIDFLSKWGHTTGNEHWFYSAQLNFRSQFDRGFAAPTDSLFISRFLAPSYTTLALGMEYKPNENFNAFISPLTGKFTTVLDQRLADAGSYGVIGATYDTTGVKLTDGKTTRWELGASARVKYKKEVMKNIVWETQFDVFANYLAKPQYDRKFPDGDAVLTNPKFSALSYFDTNWTNSVLMKVNKYVTVSLFTHLFYDWDIILPGEVASDGRPNAKLRFKEVSGVGLSYKFPEK